MDMCLSLVLLWQSGEAEVLVNRHWEQKSSSNTLVSKFRDLWVVKKVQQLSLPLVYAGSPFNCWDPDGGGDATAVEVRGLWKEKK